jgi:hypothetical protein
MLVVELGPAEDVASRAASASVSGWLCHHLVGQDGNAERS